MAKDNLRLEKVRLPYVRNLKLVCFDASSFLWVYSSRPSIESLFLDFCEALVDVLLTCTHPFLILLKFKDSLGLDNF